MNISTSKENILKKIRRALTHKVPLPFSGTEGNNSVFNAPNDDLAVQFAEAFTALEGKFIFCDKEESCIRHLMEIAAGMQWDKLYCKEKTSHWSDSKSIPRVSVLYGSRTV